MTSRLGLSFLLLLMGISWGATLPLVKIAVLAGYGALELLLWQLVFMLAAMLCFRLRQLLTLRPSGKALVLSVVIAVTGTLVPNYTSYTLAEYLPAGILAINISMVPLFAMLIALAIGMERIETRRVMGVGFGALGILLIIAPQGGLAIQNGFLLLLIALLIPFCYGLEDNIVARFGLFDLTPVTVLFVAGVMAIIVVLPVCLALDQITAFSRPVWGFPEISIAIAGVIHGIVYIGYVWMVRQAGAVFAAQIAYIVTAAGVLWSMLLLGERYSLWIWIAMGLIFVGITLVHPRSPERELGVEH